MEKYIYDNSNGLWYELHGDYYLPCLVIPEEEIHTIGIWGRKHQQYLREHHSMVYTDLVLSGKLYSYLADIDTQARNKLDLLVTQLAEKGGINEQLKARDQLAWVRAMNNIRNRAEEIVLKELFSRYTDAVREHQMTTDCLIFQNGFKLGARMMLEVMEE